MSVQLNIAEVYDRLPRAFVQRWLELAGPAISKVEHASANRWGFTIAVHVGDVRHAVTNRRSARDAADELVGLFTGAS